MIYEAFDVVVVPFPFTDRATTKRRPALVLSDAQSFNNLIGQSVLAMITSAKHSDWPLDVRLEDLEATGLSAPSIVRMKLFTLDHQLFIRKTGHLTAKDRNSVENVIFRLLGGQPKRLD